MAKFVGKGFILYEGERNEKQLLMPPGSETVFVPITPAVCASDACGLEVRVFIGDWRKVSLDSYRLEFPDLLLAFAAMRVLEILPFLEEGSPYAAWEVVRRDIDETQRLYIEKSEPRLAAILKVIGVERLAAIKHELPPDLGKAVKELAILSVRFAAKPIIELVANKKLQLDFETIGKIALRDRIFP